MHDAYTIPDDFNFCQMERRQEAPSFQHHPRNSAKILITEFKLQRLSDGRIVRLLKNGAMEHISTPEQVSTLLGNLNEWESRKILAIVRRWLLEDATS